MDFLFRAFLSVKERFGKSIILFLVMTSICIFVLSGFSIESATEKAGILARQKLGATVTLAPNMEKIKEKMREEGGQKAFKLERNPISLKDVDKVLKLDNIKSYNVTSSTEGIADGFTPISSTESTKINENEEFMKGFKESNRVRGDIILEGILNLKDVSSFLDGESSIVKGKEITEAFKNKNVAVIENTLAEQNNLKVGDKIKVKSTTTSSKTIKLEVIGIYKNSSEISEGAMRNNSMNPYNKIYVPYNVANTLKGSSYKNKVDSAQFYLNDPINVDKFLEEGKKLDIDFDTYSLDANSRAYETMMGPIENIASFAKITVIVVSIAGAIILGLIIMLSIKERRNEVGILLSLGEKKIKIVSQFLVEVLIILTLSLGTSAIIGNTVSNQIGNMLLAKETSVDNSNNREHMPQGMQGFPDMGGPNMNGKDNRGEGNFNKSKIEKISSLDVSVSGKDYSKMCGIAFIISLFGVVIPSIAIMRLQPKEILSKHD
ncbi:ABC transporter permease [Eubacterium multiforme]|uniref:ABC transport system permease protein n=1 Tax=Eubacterium multiforme TaxID=83339 RepID=A0ABT9UQZ1_9FIRM|nr:FtsX-like permease family protein [Eubacterium multiforme]MDQ0148561.1 putative ABC transport system permease protein [Eubacterium multiforme]